MTVNSPAANQNISDDDLRAVIRSYKTLRAELDALKQKVADEEKHVAELLDKQKVKKLLKDIISQPE